MKEYFKKKRLLFLFVSYVLVGVVFLTYCSVTLYQDKAAEDSYWRDNLTTDAQTQKDLKKVSKNATVVTAGTYVENLDELDIRDSTFTVTMIAWFNWKGDATLDLANNVHPYKGKITSTRMLIDKHEGNSNYQQVRYTITVSKNYWTKRFPLESHQLRIYLESGYTADQVVFKVDKEDSGVNPSLSISGYELVRNEVGVYTIRNTTKFGNPDIPNNAMYSEVETAVEINRDGFGLYGKCMIALFGTTLWILIVMFINMRHRIDPLSMVPSCLFGAVSNILVGANLIPDALQLGLLEYVNVLGILVIIAGAISIINVNRVRQKYHDYMYAYALGRVMFWTVLAFSVVGNILLPMVAYLHY